MASNTAFRPHYGTNKVVAPAVASATTTIDPVDKSVMVVNSGAAIGYFRTGKVADGAVVATTADCPVANGTYLTIEKPDGHDTIAYISATGTTFQIITGEGGVN